MKLYAKKSNRIYLSSKQINSVFYNLIKNDSYENIKDNYIFLITEDINLKNKTDLDLLSLSIIIPKHNKYIRHITIYDNFISLFNYMKYNCKDNNIIPYSGIDLF